MICKNMSANTMPATAIHFTTRHHARKYVVACLADPVSMKPNSQTQASITAPASKLTRN